MEIERICDIFQNTFKSLLHLYPLSVKQATRGNAKVIIRFDDYGVWCNHDWVTIEEEVIRLHEKYNVKISFGVVPNSEYPLLFHPLSPPVYPKKYENLEANPYPLEKGSKRVDILKSSIKKGIAEAALHGFNHPKGYSNLKNTEFYGMPYDIQYYKLQQGKKYIEELFENEVTTFIPPHNTYDKLTLDLLSEFGFKTISGKYINPDSPRCEKLGLNYLWFKYDDIVALNNQLFTKLHYKYEPINIVMLHHTNFTKDGFIDYSKLSKYEAFLKMIKENHVESYCFSNIPKIEIEIFETTYLYEYNDALLRVLRKHWPSVANNYIEYIINNKK